MTPSALLIMISLSGSSPSLVPMAKFDSMQDCESAKSTLIDIVKTKATEKFKKAMADNQFVCVIGALDTGNWR